MLVGGAFVTVDRDALVDHLAVEIVFLPERLHDELLKVLGKQHERILVGEDHHVFFAFAVGGVVPCEGELHRGVGFYIAIARFRIHGGGAGEEFIDVDALKCGGNEADC